MYKARRYFPQSAVLQREAAEEAVNLATDEMWQSGCYDVKRARVVIDSSLRQSSRTRKLEPVIIPSEECFAMRGYKIK